MSAKKAARKVAKPAAKKTAKKAAARKAAAPAKARKAAPKRKKTEPSTDEVAEAAYLNYRRRLEQGTPGNHHDDWLKAEQELSGGK